MTLLYKRELFCVGVFLYYPGVHVKNEIKYNYLHIICFVLRGLKDKRIKIKSSDCFSHTEIFFDGLDIRLIIREVPPIAKFKVHDDLSQE